MTELEKFPKKKRLPYGEYLERIASRKKKSSKRIQQEEMRDELHTDI